MLFFTKFIIVAIFIFILLLTLIKYKNLKLLIKSEKRHGIYYESICSGIGNRLMAIANLLILSILHNRNSYCINILDM